MSVRHAALDFVEFCERQQDARAIEDQLVSVLQGLGFRFVALASHVDPLRPRPGCVSVVNYPAPWLARYQERDYARIDPVFLAACTRSAPFHWEEVLGGMQLSRAQRTLLAEGASFGVRAGMTIPLRTPDITPASCSLIAGPEGIDPLCLPDALMSVIYGYGALQRRLNPHGRPEPIVLSVRERQCLTLAGRGKSDWIIGEVLGVSKRTAHNTR